MFCLFCILFFGPPALSFPPGLFIWRAVLPLLFLFSQGPSLFTSLRYQLRDKMAQLIFREIRTT